MFDTIIKNVRIIDGTGAPWYRADIGIRHGKICRIGFIDQSEAASDATCAAKVVDGCDLYAAPGFIDIHSHSDTSLIACPSAESRILQGITTDIGGNCGLSTAPVSTNPEKREMLRGYVGDLPYNWNSVGEFLDEVEKQPISVNFGTEVGHGTLRIAAMGFENRKATEAEMAQMKELLRQSLEDGAFAMSSGLIYPPGCYADTEELAELSKELVPFDAFYATHMRNEGVDVVDSVKEAIDICRISGAPLQISHHKVLKKSGWQVHCRTTIALIEQARREGLDVKADQYPYRASSTTLDVNLPSWAFEGGMDALFARIQDPETREKMRQESNASHVGRWGDIYVGYAASEKNQWVVGKSMLEIAETLGVDPAEAVMDLVLEEKGRIDEIDFGMCEEDIEYIMKQPFVMIGSDGKAASLGYRGRPHPRYFGTFPRVLSHYCRERKLFSLETAVHKMTGLPASRLGLQDRGLLKEGMWADIVLFDADAIKDLPNFENPVQPCAGIHQVYVNGILTAEDGKHTGAAAGKVLRHGVAK